MKVLVRTTTRTGYTVGGQHNVDVFKSTGLQILRHFFWMPKTKVDFNITSKYSYFEWIEVGKDDAQ